MVFHNAHEILFAFLRMDPVLYAREAALGRLYPLVQQKCFERYQAFQKYRQ